MVTTPKLPKRIWIYDDINRQNFYLYRDCTAEEVSLALKKHFDFDWENPDPCAGRLIPVERPEGGQFLVIWLPAFDKTSPKHIAILMHECLHASFLTLGPRGYAFDWQEHECITYHTEWLFRSYLEQLQ